MKHSVRRSCSFILANALSCCFCCRCRRAAACQFRGEEETHIHTCTHTCSFGKPPATWHMPHATCQLLPPAALAFPSLPGRVCAFKWVYVLLCLCVWVWLSLWVTCVCVSESACVCVWSCCFAGSNSSLHSFVCLAASIVVCLATFPSSLSSSLSFTLCCCLFLSSKSSLRFLI